MARTSLWRAGGAKDVEQLQQLLNTRMGAHPIGMQLCMWIQCAKRWA
jgi:hypothetical protein